MARFNVSGFATRWVQQTVEFEMDITAGGFAGVDAAVRAGLASGNFDEVEVEDTTTQTLVLKSIDNVSAEAEPVCVAPTPAYVAPTTYARVGTPAAAAGFAVANVEARAGGYVPTRVAHRAAR